MSFARIAGGLLTGLGRGLEAKATQEATTAHEEALARRQAALAQYSHTLDLDRDAHTQTARLELADRETGNHILATRDELGIRGRLAAQDDQRTAALHAADEARHFQIWRMQQPIELRNHLTLEDYRQTREDQRNSYTQDRQDHRTVVARGVDAGGNVSIGYADDRTSTIDGMLPPPRSDPYGDFGDGSAGPAAAAPAPRSGAPRGLTVRSSAPAAAGGGAAPRPANTYSAAEYNATLADAANDPRFRGMPQTQVRQMVDQALRDQGLRLAPNGG